MTEERDLPVFQDLVLRSDPKDVGSLRQALAAQATSPWRHAAEREAAMGRLGAVESQVMAFEREASHGIDAVGVTLWPAADGFKVTNIVPQETSELGIERYNLALLDFRDHVAVRAAAAVGAVVEVTAPRQSLDDWVPPHVAEALRRFSVLANKSTGSSHPSDQRRWFAFLIAAHDERGTLDTERLHRWLVEASSWPEDTAYRLILQYEFGLDLLNAYDEVRD